MKGKTKSDVKHFTNYYNYLAENNKQLHELASKLEKGNIENGI